MKSTMLRLSVPSRTAAEAAEKKRKFRARKPDAYHDQERAKARKRMKLRRDKNKAQNRVAQLRSIMTESQRIEVEDQVDERREMITRDWFKSRRIMLVDDDEISGSSSRGEAAMARLRNFSTKLELHEVELRLAEFEISIIEQMDNVPVARKNNNVHNGDQDSGGLKLDIENSTSAIDSIDKTTLQQILGEEYDDVLTNHELDKFMMNLDNNEEAMMAGDVTPRNEDVNVEIAESGNSSCYNVQAANGGEGRGAAGVEEHIHGLLRMDVKDFEVMDMGNLEEPEAGCFRVDAFAW